MGYSTKSTITRLSGGVFRAFAWRMARIHAFNNQWHRKAGAQGHTVLLKVVCGGLQAMMNMNGHHLIRPFLRAGDEQCGRISAAAQGNSQRQTG